VFFEFNPTWKSLPPGQGQSPEALPSERLIVTSRLSCPHNHNQGVTNESISKVITYNLALPIPYCLGSKSTGFGYSQVKLVNKNGFFKKIHTTGRFFWGNGLCGNQCI
jgi:hypothetical protein